MGLFQEYLDSKGKVAKPKVDISGDRTDPMTPPNKPAKGGKPYANSDGKSPKNSKSKGFGDQGDPELVYKVSPENKGHAPAKIPTVERYELAALVANASAKDPTFVEQLVSQLKDRGLLGVLVAEVLQHRESFKHLSEVMGDPTYGPQTCSKLVKAMSEEVAPPFADQMEIDSQEDEVAEAEPSNEEEGPPMLPPDDMQFDFGDDSEEDMEVGMEDMPPNPLMNQTSAMRHFQRAMMRNF